MANFAQTGHFFQNVQRHVGLNIIVLDTFMFTYVWLICEYVYVYINIYNQLYFLNWL